MFLFRGTQMRAGCFALLVVFDFSFAFAGGLEDFVRRPDPAFAWRVIAQSHSNHLEQVRLSLTSQTWQEKPWSHDLVLVRPEKVRNPSIGFLFITGDGDGRKQMELLNVLAERAGAVCAVLTKIPNQPLYDGRKEDALIAYTFEQYIKTGDDSWPLLFPMVKSAVRAMDTVQAFARANWQQSVESFAVSGASKRGWTTWLTAAADRRVTAIAPMVIDMLNMKVQTQWAEKVYGKQSDQIKDYTDANLIQRMDDPGMVQLRKWVDPYSYRERYTMPKLLLLGSNDPYWTVDSLRHYWSDLPEPKLVYQTPNAGHDLGGGKDAIQTLAAWFEIIADHQKLPKVDWTIRYQEDTVSLTVHSDQKMRRLTLWTATSDDRDFRDEKWIAKTVGTETDGKNGTVSLSKSGHGYQAFLLEGELVSPTGDAYKLSTEARVIPDDIAVPKGAALPASASATAAQP